MKHTLLNSQFWNHFAQKTWEKKPLLVKNIRSDLNHINESEVFKMLITLSNKARAAKDSEGFKFYIDGAQLHESEVLEYLPVKKDASLLGYHKRMSEQFADYCLVCDELLQASDNVKNILTDFTAALYKEVGIPNQFSELGLYLGNYKKTPFGVHVDGCGVFSFPIVGQKRFRLWKDSFVKKNPSLNRSFKYEKFKSASQLLIAETGDMTYWPSAAWHIAESSGEFSATWSLGVWLNKTHTDVVHEILKPLLADVLATDGDLKSFDYSNLPLSSGELNDMPRSLKISATLIKEITSLMINYEFKKYWLCHLSKDGFKPTRHSTVNKTKALKNICLKQIQNKILWFLHDKKIIIAFSGQILEINHSPDILKLIKMLNAGEQCQLNNILTPKNHHHKKTLLLKLVNLGAIQNI